MTSVLGFFADVGAALAAAREIERPLDDAVTTVTSWDELARATAAARALSGLGGKDNLIPFLRDQHARVRKFAAPFLAAFSFEGSGQRTALLDAVGEMSKAWASGRRSAIPPWMKKAGRLVDKRWRKAIFAADGSIDRKMLELFLIIELKNRRRNLGQGFTCLSRTGRAHNPACHGDRLSVVIVGLTFSFGIFHVVAKDVEKVAGHSSSFAARWVIKPCAGVVEIFARDGGAQKFEPVTVAARLRGPKHTLHGC